MLPEYRTILYATDLAQHARQGFAHAAGLARRCGARLVVVHVLEPLGPYAEGALRNYTSGETLAQFGAQARERLIADLRQRVERFCAAEECGSAAAPEVRVPEGRPAETILAEARAVGADLIVMGSHGHTAVGEIFLGSTAHRVLQKAPVPVLLVRVTEDPAGTDEP
ncbi:MAG: universal stress protein [Deferrisomatales bacterium]